MYCCLHVLQCRATKTVSVLLWFIFRSKHSCYHAERCKNVVQIVLLFNRKCIHCHSIWVNPFHDTDIIWKPKSSVQDHMTAGFEQTIVLPAQWCAHFTTLSTDFGWEPAVSCKTAKFGTQQTSGCWLYWGNLASGLFSTLERRTFISVPCVTMCKCFQWTSR